MKIRDIVTEAPLDTPLDKPAAAVGKTAGKAAFGAGELAGKIASKFGSGNANAKLTQKDRSPNTLQAIGQGIKQGTQQHFLGKSKDYSTKNWSTVVDQVIDGDKVNADELNTLLKELPSIKLSWKVDRNAVTAALTKYSQGQSIDSTERNALKIMSRDLKEI